MSLAQKRENFRKQIRSNQIQKYMQQQRKKFSFKNQFNYEMLKNIDLKDQITIINAIPLQDLRLTSQEAQKAVRQICLYASSSQKSHLFCHFNEIILNRIAALIEVNIKFVSYPIVQQLLIIMVQYADYGYDVPLIMVRVLEELWNQNYADPINQIRMKVISFVMNLSRHFQENIGCLDNYRLLIEKLFKQFPRYVRLLLKNSNQNFKKKSIQLKIVQFTQLYINILRISYEELPSNNFIQDLSYLIDHRENPFQQTVSIGIQKYIIMNLKQIVYLLDSQQQIDYLLDIRNCFYVWARHLVNFYKKYSINRQNGPFYSLIPPLFQLITAVINIDFVLDYQKQGHQLHQMAQTRKQYTEIQRVKSFENIIQDIFSQFISPLKQQILKSNDLKMQQLFLKIMLEFCSYQTFCQKIMDDHKDMVIRLIRHLMRQCQSSIRLKKLSVEILCSLVINLQVNDDEQYMQNIFSLVKQGKLVELLTDFLDTVEDQRINNVILEAIELLILQQNKKFNQMQDKLIISDYNFIVTVFQQSNGFKKLKQLYYRLSKSENVKQQANSLLKTCQVLIEMLKITID